MNCKREKNYGLNKAKMEMLKRFTLTELRQLAIYISEFQECAFITPENARDKKCWLNTTNQMIIRKAPVNPGEYITRLRIIIRWFVNHKIIFRIGMKDSTVFYNKIIYKFVRNISATAIHLEDRQRNFINIDKNDLVLPRRVINVFLANPNTMNRILYDDDDDELLPPTPTPAPTPARNIIIPRRLQEATDEEVTNDTRTLECKVCMTNKICIILTNCGHTCTTRIDNKCATCRKPFTNSTKVRMYI